MQRGGVVKSEELKNDLFVGAEKRKLHMEVARIRRLIQCLTINKNTDTNILRFQNKFGRTEHEKALPSTCAVTDEIADEEKREEEVKNSLPPLTHSSAFHSLPYLQSRYKAKREHLTTTAMKGGIRDGTGKQNVEVSIDNHESSII